MERSFMGRDLNKSVIAVKEETPEEFNDSGSVLPWPAKVSATLDAVELQNIAGETSKERFPSFVAGTTQSWFNIKPTPASTQMTIFYAGSVNVFDAITPEKAQAIMFLAGYGCISSNMSQSNHLQAQAVPAFGNHTVPPPSSTLSSPISVSSHPVGSLGVTCGEVKAPEYAAGISIKMEPPSNMVASITSMAASSGVPQFRKASLARFLQKRKERAMNSAPYNLNKKSSAESMVSS